MADADAWFNYFLSVTPLSSAIGAERGLGRVQAQAEILIGEVGVNIRRLMPGGIPSGADVHASLVFAQADGRDQVHEWTGVGVRHVGADGGGVVGGVLFVGARKTARPASSPDRASLAVDWNSIFTSASGRCSGLMVPSARGMPWSNSIMSCWIMPSHFGSG